ncbi:MAG: ATP-binding protein [Phycisphaerae bacterium]|nr:ATP-binding protein [Phycisphaerae bacterium]
MNENSIEVLLIEDNPGDALLIKEMLRELPHGSFSLTPASRLATGLAAMSAQRPDVVLLDLSLPDSSGLDTFTRVHEADRGVPVVVLTGLDDEELALEAMRTGAQDYLVKGQIDSRLLGRALRYACERQRIEVELEQTADRLVDSEKELAQFAYVFSHDMIDPLRRVLGYLEALHDRYHGQMDDDADEFIDGSLDWARRMWSLVDELLAYLRVDPRTPPSGDADCATAVRDAVAELDGSIREAQASIQVGQLPTVAGDAEQLRQLFATLIANALRFRSERPPRIDIEARREDSTWMVTVRDNGIGIEAGQVDRIFLVFKRLDARGRYLSTGTGLAVCKRIVERHGGRIWVDSAPGEGAAFHFTLPVAPAG